MAPTGDRDRDHERDGQQDAAGLDRDRQSDGGETEDAVAQFGVSDKQQCMSDCQQGEQNHEVIDVVRGHEDQRGGQRGQCSTGKPSVAARRSEQSCQPCSRHPDREPNHESERAEQEVSAKGQHHPGEQNLAAGRKPAVVGPGVGEVGQSERTGLDPKRRFGQMHGHRVPGHRRGYHALDQPYQGDGGHREGGPEERITKLRPLQCDLRRCWVLVAALATITPPQCQRRDDSAGDQPTDQEDGGGDPDPKGAKAGQQEEEHDAEPAKQQGAIQEPLGAAAASERTARPQPQGGGED